MLTRPNWLTRPRIEHIYGDRWMLSGGLVRIGVRLHGWGWLKWRVDPPFGWDSLSRYNLSDFISFFRPGGTRFSRQSAVVALSIPVDTPISICFFNPLGWHTASFKACSASDAHPRPVTGSATAKIIASTTNFTLTLSSPRLTPPPMVRVGPDQVRPQNPRIVTPMPRSAGVQIQLRRERDETLTQQIDHLRERLMPGDRP